MMKATGPVVLASGDATPSVRERAFGAAAVRASLVVGTALTFINHPGLLGSGVDPDLIVPLLLNYLVPFLVAGYSRYRLLERLRSSRGQP